ncbi:MAG: peptidoglycan-associated lipoprotein Pal [Deltaproteobacteria bacterium]|jgi:peptidoglycan-associated lipoprotein|nr:peptidoglycan-associated lipoprotein Pal [Deltaproteobacteria bacterium]
MKQVLLGPGGFAERAARGPRAAALFGLVLALVLWGCASTKAGPAAGTGGAQAGLGENAIAGNQSSLASFQKGTLGANAGGPLRDIHFSFDDYTVTPEEGTILRADALWLKDHPGTRVQIEGHCDNRGSEEYNIALGAKRAQAAKNYLVTLGIGASRISTISYGKELPLCTENTDQCWARNRRDHFVVLR